MREAGQLRDGTPVQVRHLVIQDRALLLAGFSALSSRSPRARCAHGDCEVVVRVGRSSAVACTDAA